jgi:hypothetical protein
MDKKEIINRVEKFVYVDLKTTIDEHYNRHLSTLSKPPIQIQLGNKYAKIIVGTSAWGFIALKDGKIGKHTHRQGDLLRAATWKAPAAISRGSIFDGSAKYDSYGPNYMYAI